MKIQTNNNITIPEHSKTGQVLQNLKNGTTITAKIVEKFANNEATIQINDKQFRAHFQKGVPMSNILTLVLDGRKNGSLYFSLKDHGISSSWIATLKPFLAGPMPEMSSDIYKYLKSATLSLFELNRIFYKGDTQIAGKGLAALFNAIIHKIGSNPTWLQNLAYYLTESTTGSSLAALIYAVSGESEQERRRERENREQNKRHNLDNDIKQITESIDNIIREGIFNDSNVFLTELLNLLLDRDERGFELPVFNGAEYITLKCLPCGNQSWVFQSIFSVTGMVEILARKINHSFSLDVYVENEQLREMLYKQKKEILLNAGVTDVVIQYHTRKVFLEKVFDITASLQQTGVFDTWV